jgi:hypothetical protein
MGSIMSEYVASILYPFRLSCLIHHRMATWNGDVMNVENNKAAPLKQSVRRTMIAGSFVSFIWTIWGPNPVMISAT